MEPSGEQVCYQLEGPKAYPLLSKIIRLPITLFDPAFESPLHY